jgi:drug/metabolite transporter (DMT)-like permease
LSNGHSLFYSGDFSPWGKAAKLIPFSKSMALHTHAKPVVAALLGWLLAREPLSSRLLLASVAILGAIVLIRRGERSEGVPHAEMARRPDLKIRPSEECA